MDKDNAKFYWAIIGDSAPEPVAVVGKQGARWAYTLGCPDPFAVDAPDANIQLIHAPEDIDMKDYDQEAREFVPRPVRAMKIPKTPAEQAAEREASERRLEADRKRGIVHGYSGFGARAAG